jgi:hypothetical protein
VKTEAYYAAIAKLVKLANADEMYAQVYNIAKQVGLLSQFEMRISDDLAEELVVEALAEQQSGDDLYL